MKKMMKAFALALSLAAVSAATPALVGAETLVSIYVSESDDLTMREEPYDNAPAIYVAEGQGYELYALEYENGYAYCYMPTSEEYGWVNLCDAYLDHEIDVDEPEEEGCEPPEFIDTLYSNLSGGTMTIYSSPDDMADHILGEICVDGVEIWMSADFACGENGDDLVRCFFPSLGTYGWIDISLARF